MIGASSMVRIIDGGIVTIDDDPLIRNASHPETNRTKLDVGASNPLRVRSLSGLSASPVFRKFIARHGHRQHPSGLILSDNDDIGFVLAMIMPNCETRTGRGNHEHFIRDIGQCRPPIFEKMDDFDQSPFSGTRMGDSVRIGRNPLGGNTRRGKVRLGQDDPVRHIGRRTG
jgi:hypothetical protein